GGWIEEAAMPAPRHAGGRQQPSARGEGENPPDRRDALVIIYIVLHDPPDSGGIADRKKTAPHEPALDEQLVEQRLVAGGERVRQRGPEQLRGGQRPLGPRRHRRLRRWICGARRLQGYCTVPTLLAGEALRRGRVARGS